MTKLILVAIVSILSFGSCGESKIDRIQRLVQERLAQERFKLTQECEDQLINKASHDVDSVIIEMAIADSTTRIDKPTRPGIPSIDINQIESGSPKPLFDSLSLNNSKKVNQ